MILCVLGLATLGKCYTAGSYEHYATNNDRYAFKFISVSGPHTIELGESKRFQNTNANLNDAYSAEYKYGTATVAFSSNNKVFLKTGTVTIFTGFDVYKTIGTRDFAFANYQFSNPVMPSTLQYIGNYCFFNCPNLNTISFLNMLAEIPEGTFYNCVTLASVDIPANIKTIGKFAFKNTKINNIKLPKTVTSIGEGAFQDCASLTSVYIETDILLPINIFANCPALTTIKYCGLQLQPNAIFSGTYDSLTIHVRTDYKSTFGGKTCVQDANTIIKDGLTYTFEDQNITIRAITTTEKVIQKSSITEAFETQEKCISCLYSEYQHIVIDGAIYSLGERVLEGSSALVSIIISGECKSIGDSAFEGLTNLNHAIFSFTINKYGNNIFHNSIGLGTLIYCSNIQPTSINGGAIKFFTKETDGSFGESVNVHTMSDFPDAQFNGEVNAIKDSNIVDQDEMKFTFNSKKLLITGSGTITPNLIDSCFSIPNKCVECLDRSCIASVEIEEPCTIGVGAFSRCTSLSTVVIPDNTTQIPAEAFSQTSISSLDFAPDVEYIGRSAFESCKFTTLSLSYKVILIDAQAFAYNSELSVVNYCGLNDVFKGSYQFTGCASGIVVNVITDSDDGRKYSSNKFCGITNLQKTLDADTCGIPKDFKPPTHILYPTDKFTVSYKFSYSVSFSATGVFEEPVLDNVYDDGNACWAFMHNEDNDKEIELGFNYRYQLKANFFRWSHFSDTETETKKYGTATIADKQLIVTTGRITVPSSITMKGKEYIITGIRPYAFTNYAFSEIALPSTLTTLGEGCFQSCEKMTTIDVPDLVRVIPSNAFNSCRLLNKIRLFGNITNMNSLSVGNCPAINMIAYCGMSIITFDQNWHYNSSPCTFSLTDRPPSLDFKDDAITTAANNNKYTRNNIIYNTLQNILVGYSKDDAAQVASTDIDNVASINEDCARCNGKQNVKELHIQRNPSKRICYNSMFI